MTDVVGREAQRTHLSSGFSSKCQKRSACGFCHSPPFSAPLPFCLPPVTLPRRVSIEPFSFLPCSPDFSILKRFAPPLSLLSHTEYPVCFNRIPPPQSRTRRRQRRKENRNLFAGAEIRRKDAVEWFPIKIFQQFAARENPGELCKRHNVRQKLVKIKNPFARLLFTPSSFPSPSSTMHIVILRTLRSSTPRTRII